MGNAVWLCLLVLAATDCGKALLDLTGLPEVEGTWKASVTLPCGYEPSSDFKQETVIWKTSLSDHGLRTIFRRDSNSGDQTLLMRFKSRIQVPKDQPGNVSLLLEDLEMADRGRYTCEVVWVARNKSRVTKDWTTVLTVVKVAVSKPIITAGTAGSIVVSGRQLSLTCQANGSPPIAYRWFKAVPKGNAEQVGEAATLHFNGLRVSDTGTYYCEAKNRVGSAAERSDVFELTVKDPSESSTLRPGFETAEPTVAAESGMTTAKWKDGSTTRASPNSTRRITPTKDLIPNSLAPQKDGRISEHQAGSPGHQAGLPLYVIVLIAVLCAMLLVAVFAVIFCRRKLKADYSYDVSYNNPMTLRREESSPSGAAPSGGEPDRVTPRAENTYTAEPTQSFVYMPMDRKTDNEYETLVLKMESEYEVADVQ